jgi:penicillin-binding protein 1A
VAVGVEPIAEVAGRLGIDLDAALGPPSERGPSVALGALHRGVSPLEMASAYGVLATGGSHVRPTVVARVLDRDGTEVVRRDPEPRPVVDPAVTGQVRDMLQDAVRTGTGRAARLDGWEAAGKTGTSQHHADAWFVGTVPVLSAAAWVGHPDAAQAVPDLTGGSAAAPIWASFMEAALDGREPVPFPEPPGSLDVDADPPTLPDVRPVRKDR